MIQSLKDYKYYIERDKIALNAKPTSFLMRLKELLFPNKILKFQLVLRKYEYLRNKNDKNVFDRFLLLLVYSRFRRISLQLGFSIPPNVFDSGLSIAHYGTIVVNHNSKVGINCRIHACVNIGASAGNKSAPQIGKNVYIGPGAKLFGDIKIADNVIIGANAVVNKSCLEENCVLAGNPAKVVKKLLPEEIKKYIRHIKV